MKKIILSIAIAILALTASAQIKRDGNTFSAPKTERVKAAAKCDTLNAYWQDEDGKYQIYMGSKGGLFYYKEAKTGKHAGELQKKYIPKAQAQEIKESLGIKIEEDNQQ